MMKNQTVAFLGAGSMAEAMVAGMVKENQIRSKQIIMTNRSNLARLNEIEKKYKIRTEQLSTFDMNEADVIILAMKPKDAEAALLSIKDRLNPDQIILSVLAGISTSFMEERLNDGQQVIRVMPNTSSMIGESATALSPGKHVQSKSLALAKKLMNCIGEVTVIEEEKMDVFTGIAGSGPAYIYYLVEHIEKAGVNEGLDAADAREIAIQTILGASKMMMETNQSPSILRKKVTSPNGTTAAGLNALSQNGGGNAIYQAVTEATKRSKEISAQLEKELVLQP